MHQGYHWRSFAPANSQTIRPRQLWIIAPAFSCEGYQLNEPLRLAASTNVEARLAVASAAAGYRSPDTAGRSCAGGMDRAGDCGAVTPCLQRSIQAGLMPAIHSAGQHVLEVRITRSHYMACPLTEPALPSLQSFRAHIAALLRWAFMLC